MAFGRDLAERNALFEQGMRTVVDIWGYDGTGGPLEFAVGADRGRLDVAVNPSSFRKPRPILARGTLNPAAIADAAARGWPVFTAIKDPAGAREQMAGYHAALAASGHDAETISARPGMVGGGEGGARGGDRRTGQVGGRGLLHQEPERGDCAQRR